MSIETTTIVQNITTESSDSAYTYSDKFPGAGYHKNNDGVHTAYYQFLDFIGSVKLQGTLEQYPGDDDWVDIANTQVGLGDDSTLFASDENKIVTFTGKFVWIRAAYNIQNGTLVEIRYNC
jgi:hypothetical protein